MGQQQPSEPITAHLPERTTLFDLTLTAPSEGWAVGAVFSPDFRGTQAGLILHYHDGQWQPVDDPLPNAFLNGISMVSPAEGWITGYTRDTDTSYLLRHLDGHWQPVTLPFEPTNGSYYGGIRMRSDGEGWLVVNPASGWKGDHRESLLLHYQRGTWTPVSVPVPLVWDFAPIGSDDLWLVGNASTLGPERKDSTLAHYQGGHWTTTPAPDHVLLHTLRLLSTTDGYAMGWQPRLPRWGSSAEPPAVALRYDGTTWQPFDAQADPQAQTIMLFDQSDGWAFVRTEPPLTRPRLANAVVSRVQHKVGRDWHDVKWPFPDIIHVMHLVRAAPGEYWAVAHYEKLSSTPRASSRHPFDQGLLHFVDGVWHEYPPR